MAERLRKVAEQGLRARLDFFGEQAEVIRGLRVCYEDALRLVDSPRHREHLGQPETAQDESAFLAADTVVRAISVHIWTGTELGLDLLDGAKDARVVRWQEAVDGEQ